MNIPENNNITYETAPQKMTDENSICDNDDDCIGGEDGVSEYLNAPCIALCATRCGICMMLHAKCCWNQSSSFLECEHCGVLDFRVCAACYKFSQRDPHVFYLAYSQTVSDYHKVSCQHAQPRKRAKRTIRGLRHKKKTHTVKNT